MIIDLKKDDMSLAEAIYIAKPHDEILLANKVYNEKVIVDKPYLTFKGMDNTKITFDAYAEKINPLTGKNYGTTGSTTFRVLDNAHHTTIENIVIENGHIKDGTDKGQQAVAFKSEASFTVIKNCKFLSYQDTFYIDNGTDNYVKDSVIEGDIDFIFGSANCVFDNCHISSKSFYKIGYFIAPNTYAMNRYGLVFKDCKFDQLTPMHTALGRGWYPNGAISPVLPRASFIDSSFDGDIEMDIIRMHDGDPDLDIFGIKNCTFNGNKFNDIGEVSLEYANKIIKKYN
ncbi:MAG: hypothetical protein K6A63_00865 [Acholeplasmatales bacterium]|nr:hypothetical protein [Acholeplasmatales bacterium]